MSFDILWDDRGGWRSEKLADYNLAKTAYEAGKREAYNQLDKEKRAAQSTTQGDKL